jgi:hypothetical protein
MKSCECVAIRERDGERSAYRNRIAKQAGVMTALLARRSGDCDRIAPSKG